MKQNFTIIISKLNKKSQPKSSENKYFFLKKKKKLTWTYSVWNKVINWN